MLLLIDSAVTGINHLQVILGAPPVATTMASISSALSLQSSAISHLFRTLHEFDLKKYLATVILAIKCQIQTSQTVCQDTTFWQQ